ncbi:50S ribosomal protein L10 [Pseudobacteriovorax antillogorgiicola]|uniref:Large ribosomal subunit protein uL10 n=1 Tax=Pseudobacteriovorax antillogorgiicola TaxID=1513793 RepID=A0A1Y6B2C8_9BACT|nr:50S ribosomal protein L10 [Pseudobacteriovorax antillogorgiicola]TCS59489.1 LSU ribosomal protein L10P [Pseudobacteriovorax antillogorgiicola]SME87962.1 large subunit ribosomal protein L10 [Pseudobacteriovorax antillogorgiicola]
MDRQGKEQLKNDLAEKFSKSSAVIVAEYRGMTVEEVTDLRVKLREVSAEFKVIKNRIAKKAIEAEVTDMKDLSDKLVGPIGIVCAYGDSAQATKTVLEFAKGNPNLKVTAGHMEGSVVNTDELKAIADLPSKEVLLGQIVGSLVAPHRGLLGVLNGVSRNLVQVINAIKDKKS